MNRVFEALAKDGVIVLPENVPSPARCVVAVLDQNFDSLRQEAALTLPEAKQQQMSELLLKNREGQLSEQERAELDVLAREFDTATLTRGHAMSILAQLDSVSPPT